MAFTKLAKMQVVRRFVNARNVMRNGEVILKSLSAAFLTFRFKPKRKRNFFIFEEESMGSNIFILKRQLIDCDWVETHKAATTYNKTFP
jgi:hypothetical protein